MSLSERHFNLQSALLALRNPVHLPPAKTRHSPPLWSWTTLSVVFAYALGSSLQCCFGDL